MRTLWTKEKSGEVWFRTLRTLRKIVPTMRILRYLRMRTGVRIYAVLGTPVKLLQSKTCQNYYNCKFCNFLQSNYILKLLLIFILIN